MGKPVKLPGEAGSCGNSPGAFLLTLGALLCVPGSVSPKSVQLINYHFTDK